jgi:hypothetical protein
MKIQNKYEIETGIPIPELQRQKGAFDFSQLVVGGPCIKITATHETLGKMMIKVRNAINAFKQSKTGCDRNLTTRTDRENAIIRVWRTK